MDIVFSPVQTEADCAAVAALGEVIWREHYTPLIGAAQVAYMLEKFQSAPAVARQLAEGYVYALMTVDGRPAGYCGVHKEDESTLFLSKIYIHKDFRGKGLAAGFMAHTAALAGAGPETRVYLTVNKGNSGSVAAYERLGFSIAREQVVDIGGGYVMDDYVMERRGLPG